jgi:hypothetical protein
LNLINIELMNPYYCYFVDRGIARWIVWAMHPGPAHVRDSKLVRRCRTHNSLNKKLKYQGTFPPYLDSFYYCCCFIFFTTLTPMGYIKMYMEGSDLEYVKI